MFTKKTTIILSALLVSSLFVVSFAFHRQGGDATQVAEITQKCPDDYATSEEQTAAVNAWTNNFFDLHPDATLIDWGDARHQYWIDNNCTAALKRYQEARDGKADPEAMRQIEAGMREAIEDHAAN